MARLLDHTITLFGTAVLASLVGIGGTATHSFAITERP